MHLHFSVVKKLNPRGQKSTLLRYDAQHNPSCMFCSARPTCLKNSIVSLESPTPVPWIPCHSHLEAGDDIHPPLPLDGATIAMRFAVAVSSRGDRLEISTWRSALKQSWLRPLCLRVTYASAWVSPPTHPTHPTHGHAPHPPLSPPDPFLLVWLP
jgi:hypothetical protein